MEKLIGCLFLWLFAIGLQLLVAWGFQGLWNWLMPMLFHLPTLTYWQACGILALLSVVGSFFRPSTSSTSSK